VFVQYGKQRNEGVVGSDSQLVVASAMLSYTLSPTLTGRLQYSYNQTFGNSQFQGNGLDGNGAQSLFLVSLIKSF
jgi:hypothetical protein